jgi:hypothetical protein
MTADPRVQRRKTELLAEAKLLLSAIARLAPAGCDPFTDAGTLARAVEIGLLDAPHLRGNAAGCGTITTRMVGGACVAVDKKSSKPIPEKERIARIFARLPAGENGDAPGTGEPFGQQGLRPKGARSLSPAGVP